MLTLISPAKTLDETPSSGLPTTQPWFQDDTELLLDRCRKLSANDLRELMGISESLAELNYNRFQQMKFPSTAGNAKACIQMFQGDVYKGFDAASLTQQDLVYAQDHLRILSGFYGMLRPLDLMQPYRLEMGTKLGTDRGDNLYRFWGQRLVDRLNAEHAKKPVSAVLNLASTEYFKAVPVSSLQPRLVAASFQEVRDGKPKTIAFYAKKARGMMARFQIQNRIEDPQGLKAFAEDGYRFNAGLSTDDHLVFARSSKS